MRSETPESSRAPQDHPHNTLVAAALAYQAAGRSVLPIAPGEKRPSVLNADGEVVGILWDIYKTTPADPATIKKWFPSGRLMGMGVACGPVSGAVKEDVPHAGPFSSPIQYR
jgi:hypothetical protein